MGSIKTGEYHSARWLYLFEADLFDSENRNRLRKSDALNDSTEWTATNVTVAAGATDPEGGSNAWRLTAGAVGNYDNLRGSLVGRVASQPDGVVVRIAFQANGVAPSDVIFVELSDASSTVYIPTSFSIIYGPCVVTKYTTGDEGFLIDGLSASKWTELELVWSGEDNPTFASTLRLVLYPGGIATNSGAVHVFRPHAEDELPADGLGLRSLGARTTTELSGPEGAPGASVTVRAGTRSFVSTPTDTYPVSGANAFNKFFPEGLQHPASIGKSARVVDLVRGNGLVKTTVSGAEFENASRVRDRWKRLSWKERKARLYRGKDDWTLSQFAQVWAGTTNTPLFGHNSIRAPLHDPLRPLRHTMDRPRFLGFGQCLRLDGTGDYGLVGESPDCWLLGDMTVSARFRRYSLAGYTSALAGYGNTGGGAANNTCWSLEINDTVNAKLQMSWQYGSASSELVGTVAGKYPAPTTFYDGDWHEVTAVRDTTAKTVAFYWDGEFVETVSYTNNPTGGDAGQLRLGYSTVTNAHKGDLDEVRVWSRKLTAAEVRALGRGELHTEDFVDDGLRAYYKCNESLGVYSWSDVTRLPERRMRECFASFYATGDYVQVADHADLSPTAGDWTLEVRAASADVAGVYYAVNKNESYQIYFNGTNDQWVGRIYDGASWNARVQNGTYTPGQGGFVLITMRWNNTTKDLSLFIDGADKVTTNYPGISINTNTNNLFFGAASAASGGRVWVAEVRIWNAAESDADIAARAHARLNGDETNLKAWYTFDEAKAYESPQDAIDQGSGISNYAKTTIYDRQNAVAAKKPSSAIGGSTVLENTTAELQADARFAGTGEGFQDLAGKYKPYALGEPLHIPLIPVDPVNNVYYAALAPLEEFLDVYVGGRPVEHSELASGDDVWDAGFALPPDKVFCRYGAAWNDETTDAGDTSSHDGDVQILNTAPASGATHDGLYMRMSSPITQVDLWMYATIGTLAASGADVVLSWQYWNGEGWEDLRGLDDGTKRFRFGGDGNWSTLSTDARFHTKTDASGNHWNGVATVSWERPVNWVKESLNDIATAMSLGSPSDATDGWWVRCAVTANPTAYDQTPKVSAIWATSVDAITDTAQGFVRFNAPPSHPPTATVRGDNTGGTWESTLEGTTQMIIDRFYSAYGYTYAASWGTGQPDYIVGMYAGLDDASAADLLGPALSGGRTYLDADRDGKLILTTVEAPEDMTIDGNIDDDDESLLMLESIAVADPASTLRLSYRRYFTKIGERDINPLLSTDTRKDVLSEWRWTDEIEGLSDNETNWVESEPVAIATAFVRAGATDTIATETAKWSALLGAARDGWQMLIPLGLLEHALGYVLGARVERYQIWHGVDKLPSVDGAPFLIEVIEENLNDELVQLVVWG